MKKEKGFTLVEALVAIVVISLILVCTAQMAAVQGTLVFLNDRQRTAEVAINQALSDAIANRLSDNTVGLIITPEGVKLGALQKDYYDYLVEPNDVDTPPPTPQDCAGYPCIVKPGAIPQGCKIKMIRVWTISTVDAQRQVKEIHGAVFPADDDTAIAHLQTRTLLN